MMAATFFFCLGDASLVYNRQTIVTIAAATFVAAANRVNVRTRACDFAVASSASVAMAAAASSRSRRSTFSLQRLSIAVAAVTIEKRRRRQRRWSPSRACRRGPVAPRATSTSARPLVRARARARAYARVGLRRCGGGGSGGVHSPIERAANERRFCRCATSGEQRARESRDAVARRRSSVQRARACVRSNRSSNADAVGPAVCRFGGATPVPTGHSASERCARARARRVAAAVNCEVQR